MFGFAVGQMGHNLYLVEWPSDYRNYKDWDIYDSMVVCAANTRNARSWHPSGDLLEQRGHDSMDPDWVAPEGVACLQVTHLGAAAAGLQPGVVCASYRHG